jgi:3-oxoacyl-[acyl-carrier-protein] synthase-3
MECYITSTGRYLPGPAIGNEDISKYLGSLPDEEQVGQQVLAMNGIRQRHYAQDDCQNATETVYEMAAKAAEHCLRDVGADKQISFMAAGSTYAPYSGPGIASWIHPLIAARVPQACHPMEISSHGGICSSAAAALVGAVRAIKSGEHQTALAIGTEHASEVLKSSVIKPIDDRSQHTELRYSKWFMSVFLRFMLSDGAGAFLLESQPAAKGLSLAVNWTHSLSMAHVCPLCMKLDNSNQLLSQDVSVLNRHFFPAAEIFGRAAFERQRDLLSTYRVVLPHLSSFFFRRKMERMLQQLAGKGSPPVPYWTNLDTAGNTGSASIYVMLHEYLQSTQLQHGDRILLFIPESGQFNFVLVSLTVHLSHE